VIGGTKEMKTHKDLDVWRKSVALVENIYALTGSFPKEEIYGLTNQMRRAAVSIPSNIAEGSARQGNKEFANFLHIALGSLAELETQLIISNNLGFHSNKNIFLELETVRKLLIGLVRHVKAKQ
jgi:four helix bundle protein